MDRLSVLVLCRYSRLGASSRLRFLDYLPALAARGIDATVSPFFDDDYLRAYYAGRRDRAAVLRAYLRRFATLLRPGQHDLLWIEKEALPWLPAGLERLLIGRRRTVLDFDDAWYLRYAGIPGLRGKWSGLLPGAALAIAGSSALERWCRDSGAPRTEWIPTVIDLERYPPAPPPANDVFTIGWIGTRSTLPHLAGAGAALARVCAGGQARLRLIANAPIELPGVPVDFVPWREDSEAALLAGIDAGIMPLPDEPWERGKCAYKLIQYMAAGRAVVASPVGANAEVVEHGRTGLLATTTDEWAAALEELRRDAPRRDAMGAAGRRRVEECFCLQAQADRLAAALRRAAGGPDVVPARQ